MSGRHILAIDLGTSGPKAALVDESGQVVCTTFEPTPLLLLPHGGAEQDPAVWWRAVDAAVQRLIAKAGVPAASTVAVAATAQWSGTVAIDRDGTVLGNAMTWMDSRGAPHVADMIGGWPRLEGYGLLKLWRWIRLTGGAPARSGKDPLAHILYFRAQRPHVYARTYKFLEPKDWLNYRLTGELAAGYDSIALHWVTDNRDAAHVVYDPGLLALADIERDKLPDLRPANTVLAPLRSEVARAWGLHPGIPVTMGTPDVHSAALGSGATADFAAHVYLGTSSWIVCHVPFKKTDLLHNIASLPSAIPGRYLVLDEQETAGACLDHLRDEILGKVDSLTPHVERAQIMAELDRMADRSPPGARGLLFAPWLYGERTPVEDATLRGGFVNYSLETTRHDLVRAVLEGVAFNSRWLLEHVERFIGTPIDSLRMIGGGASSSVWCQIYADVLGRPILQMAQPRHAGARGVALLALATLGLGDIDELGANLAVAATFRPDASRHASYEQPYRELQEVQRMLRRVCKRLNRPNEREQHGLGKHRP